MSWFLAFLVWMLEPLALWGQAVLESFRSFAGIGRPALACHCFQGAAFVADPAWSRGACAPPVARGSGGSTRSGPPRASR